MTRSSVDKKISLQSRMVGKTHLIFCVVLLLWSSTAQSAEGSYDDVITKLDNLLYRVVMSEVNIKERLEETEGQLKKTLQQLDSLMEHQNGLVQNDDQLLVAMGEQHEKLMLNQENIRVEIDVIMQKLGDLAASHEVLGSTLNEMERHVDAQFDNTMISITNSFDKTNSQITYLSTDLENNFNWIASELINTHEDITRNFQEVTADINKGFEYTDKRFDILTQQQADLATGHEELTSTLTKMEQRVSEQFVMTLTNITDSFDKTNNQIEDLAINQENSRLGLSSKLTSIKQDMTHNFNVVVSNVNEGFNKANVRFDILTQNQDNLAASQNSFSSALTKMESNMNDKFVKTTAKINERSDKLEDQHKTTKDQLDRLLQNLESHRNEFSSTLTRLEQSTNQNLVVLINQSQQILQLQGTCSKPQEPVETVVTSCKNTPSKTTGQYQLKPFGTDEIMIGYCEQEKFGGGWLVVQHRFDGSVDFQRNWNDYKNGFGSLGGEFWLGLDKLHRLTSNKNVELIVELKDYNNNYVYARYDAFEIGSEPQKYPLDRLGTYSGTAGDSMIYNRGKKFTTKDSDNDGAVNLNCAVSRTGAWWFDWCGNADLNGIYGVRGEWRSIYWYGYNKYDGMKYTRMLIREL